jgi:hypothetical protein
LSSKYSEAFIEQALVKVFSRGNRTVRSVADEINVNYYALKHWMKGKSLAKISILAPKEKRPQDWSAEEQLVALQESYGLSGDSLHAWCREKGLFAHHLTSWRTAFCAEGKGSPAGGREFRVLKDENDSLKRELVRKEKALAEAAALLILQKKFRALWEDGAK